MDAAFGWVFGVVGVLFAAMGIAVLIYTARKVSERRRILREGLVAEASCLETFVVHHSSQGHGQSQRRLILGFQTPDGRDVRAEVVSDVPHVIGDIVPVRYLPQRPERALPAGAASGIGSGPILIGAVMVFFTCIGLFVAATGFGTAASMR
ncbi:DUF3592 domain-containing protein [Streptomyces sp. NPDC007883]|uniref:DUF3592 domain-containing protein n=1 Tax=Streptomyces sp. NPDC007883 TaxID=3155116 RepID=UPI00340D8C5A